jgi:hypothetical protein
MVTYEEAVTLGGWATHSNANWYVWNYLVALVPAAMALSGYSNPRVIPYLPTSGMLFYQPALADQANADAWPQFVNQLFPCNMKEFGRPHGHLCNLMITVTAVMVMHFSYFYPKLGHRH